MAREGWPLVSWAAVGLGAMVAVVSHVVHLAAIVVVAVRWPNPFFAQSVNVATIGGGGLGYVFLAVLVLGAVALRLFVAFR